MLIRKARISDTEDIHRLVNYYAEQGLMLARSRAMIYESIREFTVAVVEEKVVGTGSLHIIWENLAEIRALAVDPAYTRRGIGRQLVRAFLAEAIDLGISRVFVLTYQEGFFRRCGFRTVPKEALPQKVWGECVNCPKFPKCEEVAMVIDLD